MNLYFFDLIHHEVTRDDVGTQLPDLAAAKREALATLGQMAKDGLEPSASEPCSIDIREASDGQAILRVTLSVTEY
jgi:hypothetical protein